MRNFLSKLIAYSVVLPVFLIVLMFTFLNRHTVILYLNPLEFGFIPSNFTLPLGILLVIFLIVGVLLGGFVIKISSTRHIRQLKLQLKTMHQLQEKMTQKSEVHNL